LNSIQTIQYFATEREISYFERSGWYQFKIDFRISWRRCSDGGAL